MQAALEYVNSGLKPAGDVRVEVILEDGKINVLEIERKVIEPCVEDAVRKGLEFRNFVSFELLEDSRMRVVYTAVGDSNG